MFGVLDVAWMQASVRSLTSIGFASVGETVGQRSGVLNIGLEGVMLSGALAAALGSSGTGSPWVGVACAALTGVLVTLLFAVFVVTLKTDHIVIGVGINLLAVGLTTYVFRLVFASRTSVTVPAFEELPIPLLSGIPVVGDVLFDQIPLVYLLFVLVPLSVFLLRRTSWGLRIRAVGEHPQAADTAGVRVDVVRYGAQLFAGALAGIGGAVLSIGNLNLFAENMTAGRGFIALAAVIFGRWHPVGAFGACVLFGAVDALQFRLQGLESGIPSQIWLAMPYVLGLVVLAGMAGRSRMPSALGTPFRRQREE
ncbi:MAG: ABC transporter permease [Acidimicrobiia bacterium]|nr:ABC transporter permease [Acidimicrobiia bacterium]